MAKIDINTATVEQLQSLHGIGPGLANRIREHIANYGVFRKWEDLRSVKGISHDLLKRLSEHLALTPPAKDTERPATDKEGPKIKFKGMVGSARDKLRFVSNSKEPITIEFTKTDLLGKKGEPLSSLKLKKLPNINSDDGHFVNFRIPLSRFTPPGTHTLDVMVDGASHSVKVDVVEKVYVNLSPLRFFIEARPGTAVNKDLFVKNLGNFPIVFGNPGPVLLETDFIECRTIRHIVRNLKKEKASIDQVVGLATEKLEEIYDEGSSMKIKLNGDPKIIDQGKSEKISLNISIPKTLKRPNRYRGMFPFYNTALSFTVIPTKS